jgi:sec-independent protein translocase protein TatB
MLGIGLPDLLFIALLFLLLVKPAEWPRVARTVARTFVVLRRSISPVLEEVRGVRDTLMADAALTHPPATLPPDWAPLPQSRQKGGEPDPFTSSDPE